jgi:hypothetical protein
MRMIRCIDEQNKELDDLAQAITGTDFFSCNIPDVSVKAVLAVAFAVSATGSDVHRFDFVISTPRMENRVECRMRMVDCGW